MFHLAKHELRKIVAAQALIALLRLCSPDPMLQKSEKSNFPSAALMSILESSLHSSINDDSAK